MSQYKDLGTPVNGPQAKRRGYLTQQEDEERQQELTKRLLQERLDSDARNKLERERNVIRNAYQEPNPFVEPVKETFVGTPAIEAYAALTVAAAAREKLEAVMASDNACGDEGVLDGAEDTGEPSDDAPEQL